VCARAPSYPPGPAVLKPWWRDHGPLQKAVKGIVYFYMPLLLLTYHTLYRTGYDHRFQNGSHDCRGPTKAQGSKAKPASWVSTAQSKQSEGQGDTKGGQQLAHLGPHRGDPTSSNFVSESCPGGFLHTCITLIFRKFKTYQVNAFNINSDRKFF
jgi:hypothetical protein